MKTIILTAMMLLTVAFARPVGAAKVTLFSGYIEASLTAQLVGDKLLVDVSGDGNTTLGKCTYNAHYEVNVITGKGEGTGRTTFANGDTWISHADSIADNVGLGNLVHSTEIHVVKRATGRFADGQGDFAVDVMVDIAANKSYAKFHGEFVTP